MKIDFEPWSSCRWMGPHKPFPIPDGNGRKQFCPAERQLFIHSRIPGLPHDMRKQFRNKFHSATVFREIIAWDSKGPLGTSSAAQHRTGAGPALWQRGHIPAIPEKAVNLRHKFRCFNIDMSDGRCLVSDYPGTAVYLAKGINHILSRIMCLAATWPRTGISFPVHDSKDPAG